jgi:hypothetical protein
VVVNRAGLEQVACECYGIITSTFARLLAGRTEPNVLDAISVSEGGATTAGDGAGREMAATGTED